MHSISCWFSFLLLHVVYLLLTDEGGIVVHAVPPSSHHQHHQSIVGMSGSIHNHRRISITSRLKSWLGFTSFASSGILRDRNHLKDALYENVKSTDGNVGVDSRNGRRGWIPPMLLFLLSSSSSSPVSASPLNPQTISLSGPFFQGWLLRTVDHRLNTSFILIIGSFARNSNHFQSHKNERRTYHGINGNDNDDDDKGSNVGGIHSNQGRNYDEHYIFCGISMADGTSSHFHSLPCAEDVTITGGKPSSLTLAFPREHELNITWNAQGYGKFEFTGAECKADFHFEDCEDGHLDVRMKVVDREPWSRKNSLAGPEGWLGYTSLLPCHYFVHTTSSKCEYSVVHKKRNGVKKTVKSHTGLTHMEGNYGTFFPKGWTWAQGVSAASTMTSSETFSLVGGLFVIGGVQPISWVIYIRSGEKQWEFRTTAGSQIKYRISSSTGSIEVNATTPFRNHRLRMQICSKHSSPSVNFSPPIYIPTAGGFSNQPGCRETYTAIATATIYDDHDQIIKDIRYDLSALEFGGSFQGIDMEATKTLID